MNFNTLLQINTSHINKLFLLGKISDKQYRDRYDNIEKRLSGLSISYTL